MRYTFDTLEQYVEAWKHCMRICISFSYSRAGLYVESNEFDKWDEDAFANIRKWY